MSSSFSFYEMPKVLSLSVLGYEPNISRHFRRIQRILNNGVKWIHVDIMSDDFIPGKNTFGKETITKLYDAFGDKAFFDFHLMVDDLDPVLGTIDKLVDGERRRDTFITIHREIYRLNAGAYRSKEYDLLREGRTAGNENLLSVNNISGDMVTSQLAYIKSMDFLAGLALEPGTSLNNVTPRMRGRIDLLLLMCVCSGAGGLSYDPRSTEKIRKAGEMRSDSNFKIMADGGMNADTICLATGADIFVVGTHITSARYYIKRTCGLVDYLSGF